MTGQKKSPEQQVSDFIDTARALGCYEDKEKFEESLRKIAAHKPKTGAKNEKNKSSHHRTSSKDAASSD